MKKTLAWILALTLTGGMLAGCSGSGTKTSGAPEEKTTSAAASEAGKETAGKEAAGESAAEGGNETTFGLKPLDERTTVTIGFFSGSCHSMPFYIADQMGFFDELNIDIEYESFINGPAMMEASSGWDICDVGGPGVLNGMKNYDIRMIGVCDYEYNLAVFARPDTDIAKDPKNPEIWKGKHIILPTGTNLHLMFLRYLDSIGASGDDVTITNMDVTSGLTAFEAGEGDALCVWNAVAYNAEDSGFIRITDGKQIGINSACGLCATPKALESKPEAIQTAWMMYYLTWQWCQESDENMKKAVELYVESCEEEGVEADESICQRSMDIYACPSVDDAVKVMITEEDDVEGKADRKLLMAENDLFETLDFFITLGNYTEEDREKILSENLVDPSVAKACEATLKSLGYIK